MSFGAQQNGGGSSVLTTLLGHLLSSQPAQTNQQPQATPSPQAPTNQPAQATPAPQAVTPQMIENMDNAFRMKLNPPSPSGGKGKQTQASPYATRAAGMSIPSASVSGLAKTFKNWTGSQPAAPAQSAPQSPYDSTYGDD